ncbi:MAG: DUF4255 domain-containing protein, partial [Chloroflexi bacterium]
MINHLDNLLRSLFLNKISDTLTSEAQVRFQYPDDDWRTEVVNLQQMALNIYLVDLRENRKLRTNARTETVVDGFITSTLAPARLDCHYLITAWSPAQPSPAVEPTPDEHALLYRVAAVLLTNTPLNPSRIYPEGSAALNSIPEIIRRADLPTEVLPAEGFPKQPEFWGAMGPNPRWKPSIYLVVTLPVAYPVQDSGPMVTTLITRYRHADDPLFTETLYHIGGHVVDARGAAPKPVNQACVYLEGSDGRRMQVAETNALGRFTFQHLEAG